jgi:hypothetical protein
VSPRQAPESETSVTTLAKTGRSWAEWIAALDAERAHSLPHAEIAAHLKTHHGLGDWWSQMVTVGYEQAKGRRAAHQKPEGYSATASKTLAVPLPRLWAAWQEPESARWLGEPALAVRKATPQKSLRITWLEESRPSSLDVNFYAKGPAKSQVTLEHSKLPDAESVARLKAYWAERLGRLQELLAAAGDA